MPGVSGPYFAVPGVRLAEWSYDKTCNKTRNEAFTS